ncbi:MAG: transcriptional activator NhaR [Sandaracinaceae bacterium]
MDWLNYHHLFYFWMTVKEGTVTAAAKKLRLAQPTVSEQLKSLEESLGEQLFRRAGRRLELTEVGQVVFRYADEIFALGREMQDALKGRGLGSRQAKLHVGVSDLVPKLILHRLLEPALTLEDPVQVVCREDKTERLLAELSLQSLDLVLAEAPLGRQSKVRAYNHLLGECSVTFYGVRALAQKLRPDFPRSLEGAPILLPTDNTLLRRDLDQWFEQLDVRPQLVAEFEDSALLKAFGQNGAGVFPGPSAIEEEIVRQYGVEVIGRADELRERFYAITVQRRLEHPAVRAISEAAKERIFAG